MNRSTVRHDPVVEAEITERSFAALAREADGALPELHRRVIEARNTARSSSLDGLLGRIEALLEAS